VASDGAGNVYVADSLNQSICKIDAAGAVITLSPKLPGERLGLAIAGRSMYVAVANAVVVLTNLP